MKLERIQAMPDWPARMTADVACLFMCVSETTFLTRFGRLGYKEGANTFWSRAKLERTVATQADIAQPVVAASGEDDTWDDLR